MTAEVIVLPNQNNTEMPYEGPAMGDRDDLLEAEHDALEYQHMASELARLSRTNRWLRHTATGAILIAFLVGWGLQPPSLIQLSTAHASAAGMPPNDFHDATVRHHHHHRWHHSLHLSPKPVPLYA